MIMRTRIEKIQRMALAADEKVTAEMVIEVMAEEEFSATVWVITPPMARVLLKANLKNRILRRAQVEKYKTDLAREDWLRNGESVCFKKNGLLSDGQHRLTAIIESGMEAETVVAFGCDNNSDHTYDSGLNRTVSDSFRYYDIPSYTKVSSIVNKYFVLKRQSSFIGTRNVGAPTDNGRAGITRTTLLAEYMYNESLFQEAAKSASRIHDKRAVLREPEIGGMIVYLVKDMGYKYEFVEEFFVGLSRDGWNKNRAVANLRERLTRDAIGSKNTVMTRQYKQALLIKTWNIYASGRDIAPRLTYDEKKEGKVWFNKCYERQPNSGQDR